MTIDTDNTTNLSTVDTLVVDIRRMILTGRLVPGQRFALRTLASELGVSFIPVREALRSLESQGLVISRPGRSSVVAPLDPEDLRSIYRIRLRLEPEIAFRSCELLTPEDFDRLNELIIQFSDPTKGIDEIYDAHHDFHLQLLRPAASDWDLRILENLWHAAERYVRLAFAERDFTPGEHQRRECSHRQLLEPFRSGDPDRAAYALREHLQANERLAEQSLTKLSGDQAPARGAKKFAVATD
jgi:DNA-binding GntR family transcriptional regulator